VKAGAQRIVEEYEIGDALEVIRAHDAHKIERLVQDVSSTRRSPLWARRCKASR